MTADHGYASAAIMVQPYASWRPSPG